MTKKVTVIDYGIGNLFSVSRAFERAGAQVAITQSAQEIADADRLVLPGVGAFADGMEGLRKNDLVEPIIEFARTGRPFLGICLGMQMLLTASREFGEHRGLDLISGTVELIPNTTSAGGPHKIPHIGWNTLLMPASRSTWSGTILKNTAPGASMYFVHSFTAIPDDPAHRLADSNYNGRSISAAINKENIYGCQFHPEKSGPAGLAIIEGFLTL